MWLMDGHSKLATILTPIINRAVSNSAGTVCETISQLERQLYANHELLGTVLTQIENLNHRISRLEITIGKNANHLHASPQINL